LENRTGVVNVLVKHILFYQEALKEEKQVKYFPNAFSEHIFNCPGKDLNISVFTSSEIM